MNPDICNLSPEKKYLLGLSDEELRQLILAAKKNTEHKKLVQTSDKTIISQTAQDRLERLRWLPMHMKQGDDVQWEQYTEQMLKLRVKLPSFYADAEDRTMYRYLKKKCQERLLPEVFAEKLIPCVMEYVRTGHMQPMIFAGNPGCGKTEAGKITADIMGIPFTLMSAPTADTNHGLGGDAASFVGADIGMLVRGMLDHQQKNYLAIVDEVEKAPHPMNRTAFPDELLSLCDGNGDHFTDNYLGYPVDASHCAIIMTCNDLSQVSAPLRDRAEIIEFPDVEIHRLEEMIQRYCNDQMRIKYPGFFDFDKSYLKEAIDTLYDRNVHSIRQHRKLVDDILRNAYIMMMNQDQNDVVVISREMIDVEVAKIGGEKKLTIGFCRG